MAPQERPCPRTCEPGEAHAAEAGSVVESESCATNIGVAADALPADDRSRCLDALVIALNERCPESKWYASTSNLQLASLGLCIACRSVASFDVRVTRHSPRSLWAAPSKARTHARVSEDEGFTRVPVVRAVRALWDLPATPESLLEEDEVENILASPSLRQLSFGYSFEHSLDGVEWAPSVRKLALGRRFNHSVDNVEWPASLEELSFGGLFDRCIEGARLPGGLVKLTLGDAFDRPIGGVAWPASLRQLAFGRRFNRPVAAVEWPPSLEQLAFGDDFNQPLDRARWPPSLRKLRLGWAFDQPLDAAWTRDDGLEVLVLAVNPRTYSHTLVGVRWPPGFRKLTLCYGFAVDPAMLPRRAEVTRLVPRNMLLYQEGW